MATARELRPGQPARQAPTAEIAKKTPDAAAKGPAASAPSGPAVEGGSLDPDVASSMQGTFGNELVQSLTGGARAGVDANEQEEETGQDQEQEVDSERGRGNAASASGMGLAGGGGGHAMEAPWSMGHYFGGDDDGDAVAAPRPVVRWRPPDPPLDPDEPPPPSGEGDDDDPVRPALDEARAALGEAIPGPGWLQRGLRYPERLAAVDFGPHTLALLGPQHPFQRARAALRLVAEHDQGVAGHLARLALAGRASSAPSVGGLAGATARALACLEALLGEADPAWGAVLAVAVEPGARARVEAVAAEADDVRTIDAPELFRLAHGGRTSGVAIPGFARVHAAAEAVLLRIAGVEPLPEVVLPQPPEAEPVVDPFADLFRSMTGGEDAGSLGNDAVYDAWNQLLAALGGLHVELASAALAVGQLVPLDWALDELARFSETVGRATGRAVALGEAAEASGELEAHLAACEAFAAARGAATYARAAGIRRFAAAFGLFEDATPPADPALIQAVAQASSEEPSAELLLAVASLGGHPRALATSLLGGAALHDSDWGVAWESAMELLQLGTAATTPYRLADAAILAATAAREVGDDWREVLRAIAAPLHVAGAGGAVNLLVAAWAEAAAAEATASAGGEPDDEPADADLPPGD